jgi:hypothetical protein
LAESVDNEKAERSLNEEWNRVISDEETEYVDDHMVRTKIKEVLNASQLTYKYILVTNVIAKAVNPDIHYRSMQAKADLEGAYNSRSLGHDVLVEWEKDHGERLGGSNEPFLNKPARYPEFEMSNAARSQSAQERLYNLLERLEDKTNAGEIDPVDVLRQTLYEISQLEPQTVDFESPSEAPFDVVASEIEEYINKSGGGERLAAVTAGAMKSYYSNAGGDGWEVQADHANVPDEFSEAAGDVEIFKDDELRKAFEVKDKPTERSDIQHIITRAQKNELGEYHYLVGAGFKDGERDGAIEEVKNAPIEVILLFPEEIISLLKFISDAERVLFVEAVGEFLNDMRAEERNKEDFTALVERIQ